MRILHITPTYYPATYWGGPIFSTKALCDGLARVHGIELRVLTTDAAGPAISTRITPSKNPETFPAGYEVLYARRIAGNSISPDLLARLLPAIRWADVVHVTASYSFPTIPALLAARWYGKPVVWSPRGSLQATEEWKNVTRRRTKIAYERLCQFCRPRDTVLHVTAEIERDLSVRRLNGIRTALIPNSVDMPVSDPQAGRSWRPDGQLRLIFLSRLHQKKGLEILLEVMPTLPSHMTLDIYGTGESSYVEHLKAMVNAQGLGKRVMFHGHVDGPYKTDAFRSADLFVLPTYTENFGIAIAEALAHGVPVITTHQAPWSGIEREGCGAWIPLDADILRDTIMNMETKDMSTMGRRGHDWMRRDFSQESMVTKMLDVYRFLLARA
jgi:glycosyltransferase involved in cell wall biosynthesis